MNLEKNDFLLINSCYAYLNIESLSNLSLVSKNINAYMNSIFFIKKIYENSIKEIDNLTNKSDSNNSNNTNNTNINLKKEKYTKIKDNISIKSKDTSLSSNTNTTKTSSDNKIANNNKEQQQDPNTNVNNNSYFGYVGNMFSTINHYTIGTIGTIVNLGYSAEKVKKTESDIFYEDKELLKSFKLKLSYWEDILEEMLNQKTLMNTIDITNKYIGNLKNERLKSMRNKNNLKYQLEDFKENFDSNAKMTPQILEMYNGKLKLKIEEMSVKKNGLIAEIKKVEDVINSTLIQDKKDSLCIFKLQRYLDNFFDDEMIYKNYSANEDFVYRSNKNTNEVIKKDNYRLMVEQFNPLALYYKERSISNSSKRKWK